MLRDALAATWILKEDELVRFSAEMGKIPLFGADGLLLANICLSTFIKLCLSQGVR